MLKENALTTIERAKRFIYGDINEVEAKQNVTDDSRIADAVNAASAAIESYCRRKFKRQRHIQNVIDPTNEILFNEYPVHEIATINGRLLNSLRIATFLESESGILDIYGAQIRGIVEYEAGYTLPKDGTEDNPSDLPSDLELATLRLVEKMYVDEDGFVGESGSIKLGDWTVRDGTTSQQDIDSVIPNEVAQLLDGHARQWVVT
ncbi:hypothetical protein ACFPRA_01385 [Sporosarcina soli]|uniref:Phage gp6-like head-tail connector protein n=1 Tax=Sporosarcina soli TaxID=334736 RepID=A0ABW0TDR4_9BACL